MIMEYICLCNLLGLLEASFDDMNTGISPKATMPIEAIPITNKIRMAFFKLL